MIGTVQGLIEFAAARGVTVAEEEAPILLTKAGDYLSTFCWYGDAVADSDDVWPRTGLIYTGAVLVNADGDIITGLKQGQTVKEAATPRGVVTAAYRLALEVANGTELMPVASGAQVLEERVEGAVTVRYSEGSLGTAVDLPWLDSAIGMWTCGGRSRINFNVGRG